MRHFVRSLAAVLCVPAALAGCANLLMSSHPAPDLHVDSSPAAVARGAYLVQHVGACFDCHSPLSAGHQPLPGQVGHGGRRFDRTDGLPGVIYSTNLTSDKATGLGGWTDGEIVRAIREGVDKDGHALFPIMPYPNYRQMADSDVQAIVAYLRTLPAAANAVPERQLDFPVSLIVNTIPKPVEGAVPPPAAGDRGKYLFTMASCADCHTPRDTHGAPLPGKANAGGMAFNLGGHPVLSANITQDKASGVGSWSDTALATAVQQGMRPDGTALMPVMPWPAYGGMSAEDMKALVGYLKSLPAVNNAVPRPH